MNLKTRLSKLENERSARFRQYLDTLSDDELSALIKEYDEQFPLSAKWFAALTDDELDILRDGRPGAKALERKYYEYKKQNQTA